RVSHDYQFFFSSRRRHTRCLSDWSSDVCSSDLPTIDADGGLVEEENRRVVEQSAGDVQALPHSPGVALDLLLLATGQTDEVEERSEERRVGKECGCRWAR